MHELHRPFTLSPSLLWFLRILFYPTVLNILLKSLDTLRFFRQASHFNNCLRGSITKWVQCNLMTMEMRTWSKEKLWKCSTLFGRFQCRHCPTNIVNFDWNGNATIPQISKIVASSTMIATTSISPQISIQRLYIVRQISHPSSF